MPKKVEPGLVNIMAGDPASSALFQSAIANADKALKQSQALPPGEIVLLPGPAESLPFEDLSQLLENGRPPGRMMQLLIDEIQKSKRQTDVKVLPSGFCPAHISAMHCCTSHMMQLTRHSASRQIPSSHDGGLSGMPWVAEE